ncbi:MAG: nucleotidyltransferase family protein, partial [Polyangiaceae bacterium]
SLACGDFGIRSDVDVVVADARSELVSEIDDALGRATGRAIDVLVFETLSPSFQERVLRQGWLVS